MERATNFLLIASSVGAAAWGVVLVFVIVAHIRGSITHVNSIHHIYLASTVIAALSPRCLCAGLSLPVAMLLFVLTLAFPSLYLCCPKTEAATIQTDIVTSLEHTEHTAVGSLEESTTYDDDSKLLRPIFHSNDTNTQGSATPSLSPLVAVHILRYEAVTPTTSRETSLMDSSQRSAVHSSHARKESAGSHSKRGGWVVIVQKSSAPLEKPSRHAIVRNIGIQAPSMHTRPHSVFLYYPNQSTFSSGASTPAHTNTTKGETPSANTHHTWGSDLPHRAEFAANPRPGEGGTIDFDVKRYSQSTHSIGTVTTLVSTNAHTVGTVGTVVHGPSQSAINSSRRSSKITNPSNRSSISSKLSASDPSTPGKGNPRITLIRDHLPMLPIRTNEVTELKYSGLNKSGNMIGRPRLETLPSGNTLSLESQEVVLPPDAKTAIEKQLMMDHLVPTTFEGSQRPGMPKANSLSTDATSSTHATHPSLTDLGNSSNTSTKTAASAEMAVVSVHYETTEKDFSENAIQNVGDRKKQAANELPRKHDFPRGSYPVLRPDVEFRYMQRICIGDAHLVEKIWESDGDVTEGSYTSGMGESTEENPRMSEMGFGLTLDLQEILMQELHSVHNGELNTIQEQYNNPPVPVGGMQDYDEKTNTEVSETSYDTGLVLLNYNENSTASGATDMSGAHKRGSTFGLSTLSGIRTPPVHVRDNVTVRSEPSYGQTPYKFDDPDSEYTYYIVNDNLISHISQTELSHTPPASQALDLMARIPELGKILKAHNLTSPNLLKRVTEENETTNSFENADDQTQIPDPDKASHLPPLGLQQVNSSSATTSMFSSSFSSIQNKTNEMSKINEEERVICCHKDMIIIVLNYLWPMIYPIILTSCISQLVNSYDSSMNPCLLTYQVPSMSITLNVIFSVLLLVIVFIQIVFEFIVLFNYPESNTFFSVERKWIFNQIVFKNEMKRDANIRRLIIDKIGLVVICILSVARWSFTFLGATVFVLFMAGADIPFHRNPKGSDKIVGFVLALYFLCMVLVYDDGFVIAGFCAAAVAVFLIILFGKKCLAEVSTRVNGPDGELEQIGSRSTHLEVGYGSPSQHPTLEAVNTTSASTQMR